MSSSIYMVQYTLFTWIELNRFADVMSVIFNQFSRTVSGVTSTDKFCRKTQPAERII